VGGPGSQWPGAFARDGSLIYDDLPPSKPMRVMRLHPDGRQETLVEHPQFPMRLPAVSPDGKWLAYSSTESGASGVFVRSLGGGPGKWQASTGIATQPAWSRDSRTLFYREGNAIVAAAVGAGAAFEVTSRRAYVDDRFSSENTINYDVHPDGKRLLVIIPSDSATGIGVVLNWQEELRRRSARP
jgi:Tol biopolymer transport system component